MVDYVLLQLSMVGRGGVTQAGAAWCGETRCRGAERSTLSGVGGGTLSWRGEATQAGDAWCRETRCRGAERSTLLAWGKTRCRGVGRNVPPWRERDTLLWRGEDAVVAWRDTPVSEREVAAGRSAAVGAREAAGTSATGLRDARSGSASAVGAGVLSRRSDP